MDVMHNIRGFSNVQGFIDGLSTIKRPCPELQQTQSGNIKFSAFFTNSHDDLTYQFDYPTEQQSRLLILCP